MLQVSPVTNSEAPSPSSSEKDAKSTLLAQPAARSCAVCRARKVRCDKQSPCSNCRRASIACVYPSTDRLPRWARRLERVANAAALNPQPSQEPDPATAQVIERLRSLESLVQELRGQLEQAKAANTSATDGSSGMNSPESSGHDRGSNHQRDVSTNANASNVQSQFGRLVLKDANQSRYVSSGFWSRIDDELDELKISSRGLGASASDTSEDEPSPGKSLSSQEPERLPSGRHAFLFGHNLSSTASNTHDFHPLPSQIPFLISVFSENVNTMIRIVHVPTVAKMIRELRGDMTSLKPANEALMFAIYYSAIISMEEDEIMTNFGIAKTDLNLKYRLGLEHALAKADFLNVPNLVLVQALAIFLCLARRHDSPRFVWMMTGLAIRMGQALGLQRDGAKFENLTPYEVELRRRTWWVLYMLDMRSSEDQGMDYTIARGSFDTKFPLNINDADIGPATTQMPTEREGITDMTFPLVQCEMMEVMKQMMTISANEGAVGIDEQNRLLNEIYQGHYRRYLQYSAEPSSVTNWVGSTIARLVVAKMTLFIYLPFLFSPPSEHFSDTIKNKLLVAAIEVAEYNHALNAEESCRHWRWVYQTYTQWHSVVYLLIECSRRPWSPLVERAWVALHSQWLIPPQSHMDKSQRVWVPLRKLTIKARKHRDAELERLRSDPQAAERLEMEDQRIPVPASPGPFPAGSNVVEIFRERWRHLLAEEHGPGHDTRIPEQTGPAATRPSGQFDYLNQPSTTSIHTYNAGSLESNPNSEPAYLANPPHNNPSIFETAPTPSGSDHFALDHTAGSPSIPTYTAGGLESNPNFEPAYLANPPHNNTSIFETAPTPSRSDHFALDPTAGSPYTAPTAPPTLSGGPGYVHWLWADASTPADAVVNMDGYAFDANMDVDLGSGSSSEVDWYNWAESAKQMEMLG